MQNPVCQIVADTDSFLIVAKPSGLATVPLAKEPEGPSLLTQLLRLYPEVGVGVGRYSHEGLVLHRLDTETCGLVLVAKDRVSYQRLQEAQHAGRFIKTYLAVVSLGSLQEGFPPSRPSWDSGGGVLIESRFRAFGVGRRAVRPVIADSHRFALAKGGDTRYTTYVQHIEADGSGHELVQCKLNKGFRHQIRSHLAWTGHPIVGDLLYGGETADIMHLAAVALEFPHPLRGDRVRYDWTDAPPWTRRLTEKKEVKYE